VPSRCWKLWWKIEIRKISEREYKGQVLGFKKAAAHLSAVTGTLDPLREILEMVEPRQASQFLKLWESAKPYVLLSQSWRLSNCRRCVRAIKSSKILTSGEGGETYFVRWECLKSKEIDAITTTQLHLERVKYFGTKRRMREFDGVVLVNILREPNNLTDPWIVEAGTTGERSINVFVGALAKGSPLNPNQLEGAMPDTELILPENSSRLPQETNMVLTDSTGPFPSAAHQADPGMIS
jgi:hypothetical protein